MLHKQNSCCSHFCFVVTDVVNIFLYLLDKCRKKMLPSLFVAPAREMRCSITEISKPVQGPLQERKCAWESLVKYQSVSVKFVWFIRHCKLLHRAIWFVPSQASVSPAVETKDEWTYRGYYGVSSFAITIGLVDSDNPLLTEGIL